MQTYSERSDDDYEQNNSLYDFVRNKREADNLNDMEQEQHGRKMHNQVQNLNLPVSRFMYSAILKESVESIKVKEIIDKLITEEIPSYDDENSTRDNQLTGLLAIKGSYLLHFIEGDSQIINQKYIQDFLYSNYKELFGKDEEGTRQSSFFQQINVLAFTDENPKKLFDKHYSFQKNPSPQLAQDLEKTEEQVQQKIWETYWKFCQAISGQRHSKHEGGKKPRTKQEQQLMNDFEFSNDDWTIFMLKSNMSIEDYHEIYLDDVPIQLDSEQVYPFTPSLIANLEYSERGYFEKQQI